MRNFLYLLIGPLFCLPGAVTAQVYKCTDQNGTVTYTEMPCAKSAKSQQLPKIDTTPANAPEEARDWEKENEEFKQRQQARNANGNTGGWNPTAARGGSANQKKQADQRLIAACEANHGVRCSDPNTIAQIKRENTPITKSEQQQAIGQRKARERDEAFDRAARR